MKEIPAAQLKPVANLAKSRRTWFQLIALGALLLCLLGILSALSLIDTQISFPSEIRWVLWGAVALGALTFWFRKWRRTGKAYTPHEAACTMESAEPEIGQQLRTALEVSTSPDSGAGAGGHGFAQQLISNTEGWLGEFDWRTLVPRRSGVNMLGAAGLVLVALAMAGVIWPEFGLGLRRILLPNTTTTYTRVAWENPPEWFDQRHPPLVRVKLSGREASPSLFVREAGSDEWETIALTPRDNSPVWDAVLPGRDKNLEVYAVAGDGKTERLQLIFEPIPELREAKVTLNFPKYLGRESETRSGGDVRAVEGTEVQWRFVFNTAPAKVEWAVSGEEQPEELAPDEVCVTAVHTLEAGMRNPVLTVTDRRGRPVDAWRFEAEGLVDKLPEIEILEPAKDQDATSITELPVRIRAKDDHGLSEVGVVMEAAGETRWILEKVIDVSNQRHANEMITAMLEEVPLEITDNVRIYAYALDQKLRGGPRSLSHLRSIDIRQFKRRWKFAKLSGGDGPKVKMEDVADLEKIISQQREVVSEVFVLKGGGRDTLSQEIFESCATQAVRENEISEEGDTLAELWRAKGVIEADDIALLEVAAEQMREAAKELRVPRRDEAFEIADSSLSNLLRLRKRLITLIIKGEGQGEPMDPKDLPPELTSLAEEARRLAREEADVRSHLENEEIAAVTDPAVTRRQQEVAIADAGELYSKLLTHPERTEGALTLMDEAEKAMDEAGRKLRTDRTGEAALDLVLAEQRLLELAEFLEMLDMMMLSEAMEEMASKAEQEAEELAESTSESPGESPAESEAEAEGESESNSNSEGKSKGGSKGSKGKGSPEGMAKSGSKEKGESKGKEKGESKGLASAKGESGKGKGEDGKGDKGKGEGEDGKGEKGKGLADTKGDSGKGKGEEGKGDKGKGKGKGEGDGKGEKGKGLADTKGKGGKGKGLADTKGEGGKGDEKGKGAGDDGDSEGEGEGGKSDEEGKEGNGTEALAKAARRARLTDEILKALAEREAKKGGENGEGPGATEGKGDEEGEAGGNAGALADLRGELGMGELAEALEELAGKGKGDGEEEGTGGGEGETRELAGQMGNAGERMREFARELNASQLARLAEVKAEIGKLKQQLEGGESGSGSETSENPGGTPTPDTPGNQGGTAGAENERGGGVGPPTAAFFTRLERLNDQTLNHWGRFLKESPFDRDLIPLLDAIDQRVDELVGEIPQVSAVTGGRRSVPEESRREIEDYFRDLSDDFGEETWIDRR